MSADLLLDEERATLRLGLEAWRDAQRRAGANDGDIVGAWRMEQPNGEPVATASLGDVDGILSAYLKALPAVGELGFDLEDDWRECAGAVLAVIGADGRRSTALLTIDSELRSTWHDDHEIVLGPDHGDMEIRDGRFLVRCQHDDDYVWCDPLSPPNWATECNAVNADEVALGGLTALVHAAGGRSWIVGTPIYVSGPGGRMENGERVCVFRVGATSAAVKIDAPEASMLRGSIASELPLGLIRLAHVKNLSSFAERGGTHDAVDQVAMALQPMLEAARKLPACAGDWRLLMRLPGIMREARPLSFVVPGFIPRGGITVIAGAAGTGKSTLAHDLALVVSTDRADRDPSRTWLGVPASEIAEGRAVFLSGEDDEGIINDRRIPLEKGLACPKILEFPADGSDLAELLERLSCLPNVALLVVDPARKFILGSEDDSANVERFMTTLTSFAARAGCAVVITHHLRRNAKPASPAAVLDAIRGSQAFVDRPRSVIGVALRREGLSVAVIKKNIPPSHKMRTKPELFQRDETTLRLLPGGEDVSRPERHSEEPLGDEGRVVEAVRQAHASDRRVTRTGRHGVYEFGASCLAGLSRNAVHAATASAIRSGQLLARPDGSLFVVSDPLAALPNAERALPETVTD